jgi:hypothetical protein
MGRIITLSVAVLMTIGGTGVVLSETVKQTSWGGTTKAAIMQVPSGETTATDPSVTGFAPLSGPTMGKSILHDTVATDPTPQLRPSFLLALSQECPRSYRFARLHRRRTANPVAQRA